MSDKTEAPTPKRLEEARSEGRVPRSIELNSALALMAGALLIGGPGKQLAMAIQNLMIDAISRPMPQEITSAWLQQLFAGTTLSVLPSLGLILVGMLAVGSITTLAQTGLMWTNKNIGFHFERLNPLQGFKRIFSTRGLIELGRALLKLLVIGWTAYSYLRGNSAEILSLSQVPLAVSAGEVARLSTGLAMRVGSTYLIIAAADYAYQRWDWMRNLRMSKQEIKEENKRAEGDPMIKSRIRGQMRRMARMRMMADVPKATVVVVNPTHLAVAIQYQQGMAAPKVLAKGAHLVAQRIVQLARSKGIPVVQNIPLARAMYKHIDIGQPITPDLYVAMAEVLAYVYRMRQRPPVRTARPGVVSGINPVLDTSVQQPSEQS